MSVISIIGPKGGIGKTTLSINTASALTKALEARTPDNRICLVDLDLRLPTISSLLDSHPQKTFYDLFETLANKTWQVDFLRNAYQILTWFQGYLQGDVNADDPNLGKCLAHYKNMNSEYFRFADFRLGDRLYDLFLQRGKIHIPADLKKIETLILGLDIKELKEILREHEKNSRPTLENYVNYIEEYRLSIIGGEVPILGKKNHRKRINEPEFLMMFLDFLHEVFRKFEYVILDTPAGGVNHLSSLMNSIEQVLFVFDLSNNIAINGSIDAMHSFIDYYEDFQKDFLEDRLTGLDKAYANWMVSRHGKDAVLESLEQKKFGIVFNRFQEQKEIPNCLNQLRDYLDILDKYVKYKNRIHIVGMIPYCKIINITNNRGVLFYAKDRDLSGKMDLIARNVITENSECPTLADDNRAILHYLEKNGRAGAAGKLGNIVKKLQVDVHYGREKTEGAEFEGVPFSRG